MKTVVATKYIPIGMAVRTVTHFIVNRTPINHRLRERIKNCPACDRRTKSWNNLVPIP